MVKSAATTLLATAGIALAGASTAAAATPFSVGSGENADVAVGEDGTLYLAWDNGQSQMTYCRVPPGATACAVTKTFANPANTVFTAGQVNILDRGSGAVTLLEGWGNFNAPNRQSYAYNAPDGETFAAGVPVGVERLENAVLAGPNEAVIASTSTEPRIGVQRVALTGPANTTRAGLLPGPGNGGFDDPEVGLAPKPVVAYSGSGSAGSGVFFNAYTGANPGGESVQANWGPATNLDATGRDARVGAGPNSTWVMYYDQEPARHVLRQWNGTGFGDPVAIGDFNTGGVDVNDVAVSPTDQVYAIWVRSGELRWFGPGFINGGTAATGQSIYFPRLDANSGGQAVAVWQNNINGGQIMVARLDLIPGSGGPPSNQPPAPPLEPGPIVGGPTSTAKSTFAIGGVAVTLSLSVPRDCVPVPNRLRAKVKVKQLKRLTRRLRRKLRLRALRPGKIKVVRVDFALDGRRVLRDRKKPFEAVLGTIGLASGKHTVKATVYMKRGILKQVRGKRRLVYGKKTYKRTLKKAFTVCG